MAASRETAPVRTLTAVRAIAAVAGIPPNSGLATFARPRPNSSRSGSWRWDTLIASATVADNRLEGRQGRHGNRRCHENAQVCDREGGQVGRWKAGWQSADRCDVDIHDRNHDRGCHHCDQSDRDGGLQPQSGGDDHEPGDSRGDSHGYPIGCGQPVSDSTDRHEDDLLPSGLNAQCCRHLLQRDDHRDAQCEPLDHGQRDEAHIAPEPGQRHDDEQ